MTQNTVKTLVSCKIQRCKARYDKVHKYGIVQENNHHLQ